MEWPISMLPGDGRRRTPRDWLVDLTMLALAFLVGVVALASTWHQHSGLERAIDIAIGAAGLVALWWRRRWPTAGAIVFALASIFATSAVGVAIALVFNAAVRAPWRPLIWIGLLSGVAMIVGPLVFDDPHNSYAESLVFGLLITAIAIGWGLFARARRQLVRSLRDRAAQLEADQRLRVEQARGAERRRIAREMHDVLAHRVSLLAVHAGALEYRGDASPEEVTRAAGVIRASAHAALEELREVIGVLRDEDGDGAEPPQPTLTEIPALIAESRAAGMRVRSHIALDGVGGEPLLGRTAYRVVQEGLTNARKHAPAAAVEVSVSAAAGPLVVEVRSRPVAGGAPTALPGAGTGLIGLAERVELAGGRLEHGRDDSGDFRLRATLPRIA